MTKLVVTTDGKATEVEVDPVTSTVTIGGRTFAYRVVASTAGRVELEVGGETIALDGWPEGQPAPPGRIALNGEEHSVGVTVRAGGPAPPPASRAPTPPAPAARGPLGESEVAVLPPMPGKVVELRVRAGDRVHAGEVLLVLEAMKMRNEIASPVDGEVARVAVESGANVRAGESMLVLRKA